MACLIAWGSGCMFPPATVAAADEEPQPGKQVERTYTYQDDEGNEATLRYLMYLPESYAKSDQAKPLVMFLHGSGERGDDLELVKKWGPPRLVAEGQKLEFILVSPQCPKEQRWQADVLAGLIKEVQGNWGVDKKRTYITGLSMGGYGTWALLAKHADLFAAAIPICGGGDPATVKEMVNVPIWVFHGAKDQSVPLERSEQMVEALKEAGGDVRFTVYPDLEHNSWTATYENPETFRWLLEQKKDD